MLYNDLCQNVMEMHVVFALRILSAVSNRLTFVMKNGVLLCSLVAW